jgi:hypothetical protein
MVAGICALLASLSVVFLANMRSSIEESQLLATNVQARIMLYAACNYVQEASRLGYDESVTHGEAFGWIDVRDGSEGPKISLSGPSLFPVGVPKRFPMYVWKQTRYAIKPTLAYNPISSDESDQITFGRPYLRNPDPQPVSSVFEGPANNGVFRDYVHGESIRGSGSQLIGSPRTNSLDLAWFRILRTDKARFLVTCGSGATLGFCSYDEAVTDLSASVAAQLFVDRQNFGLFQAQETRLWYQIEWSAAVLGGMENSTDGGLLGAEHFVRLPVNASHQYYPGGVASQSNSRNMVGTIRWIQRLTHEPQRW